MVQVELGGEADLDRKGDIDAIFGELYYDLNDKTSLTVGLRSYDQTMHLKLLMVIMVH